ncbi:MAG: redox-sensing transcriptional repressor [Herbinix sp.]|jgi:redox-sensing transcriptional repressor|nr:redox-sensing transcriptional repressor [Herbinix sp.]
MSNKINSISKPALNRFPDYLNYLNLMKNKGLIQISSTMIAEHLKLNPIKVRKDLELTGAIGKPRSGFLIEELIMKITDLLGYNNSSEAVLVGVGQLGKTLLSYEQFADYGLSIVVAFDKQEALWNTEVKGKKVLPMEKCKDLINRMKIHIGIITVTADDAQEVCDLMVDSGILAIWNFAPVHLTVPEHILVQNENMAASLALLSKRLKERIQ